jgi:hypothetical protein
LDRQSVAFLYIFNLHKVIKKRRRNEVLKKYIRYLSKQRLIAIFIKYFI